ncbi:lachesin-like [Macrobrachium rosenbergii]|uniref:lachesin-like n=1 Tax=Macrobrachium rosenbergii TaxID=79674 RepID=UPI0034D71BA9
MMAAGRRHVWSPWARMFPVLLATHAVCFSPEFSGPVTNVTVARGRDAKFTCLVRHLGGYRVGWVKADTKAIQAIHTHVITHNPRVHVNFDDHSTWHLVIKEVTEDDKGPYMCQINTDPMKSQMGFLEVLRPPEIDDDMSSGDVVVTEGEMATLKCVATGHPKPSVTWIREDSANITISDGHSAKQVQSWEGEALTLRRVSRDDMGAYLCIAQNKVPPQVSKRVLLHVHFHPIIHVPNQLIGSPYGTDVTLECKVEASPKPVTFWSNSHGEMLMSSSKYKVSEEHNKPGGYSVHMRLTIRDLTAPDIGNYACVAKNSIGEVDSNINVYYISPPTTTPPRLLPTFIETNRVDQDDNHLTSPGFVPGGLTPLDAVDNEVFKMGTYEGSGLDPWLYRRKYTEKGRSIPTSESASLPEIKPRFHDSNDLDNSLGASSSNTQYSGGFALGASDSLLSRFARNFALVALGLMGGLIIRP